MTTPSPQGSVVTFYSWKGGVGRTMVLANVAVQLARMGRSALVVDWDLEAPGLERYFTNLGQSSAARIKTQPAVNPTGLMGLLCEASDRGDAVSTERDWRDRLIVIEVPPGQPMPNLQTPPTPTPIHFLPSGYGNEDYATKLSEFSWSKFFADSRGAEWLEALRDQWSGSYDFVLIDSRTGLTDSGGVCTIQMPHMLVLVFTANDQSVEGGLRVVAAAQRERRDFGYDRSPLAVIPVLSRWEGEKEVDIGEQWMKRFDRDLAPLTAPWLPKDFSPRQFLEKTRVPHVSRFTFGEPLPVLTHSLSDPGLPGLYFDTIAQLIRFQLSNVGTVIDPTYIDEKYRNVAPEETEIFVSYQMSDDLAPPDSPNSYGFVSYLMRQLRYEFSQLGGLDSIRWVERSQIEPSDGWSERISIAVNKAEFFIAIISNNYIRSPWCQQELSTIVSRTAKLDPKPHRLFRVDRTPVPEELVPEPLRRIVPLRFYRHKTGRVDEFFQRGKVVRQNEYFQAVHGLALAIRKQLGAPFKGDKIGTTDWTIIVASSNGDQLTMLLEGAQKIAAAIDGSRSIVLAATSVEQVRKHRESRGGRSFPRDQLLIVEAALPSRDSITNPEVFPGLELIKSIARTPKAPACIVVSDNFEHLRIVQSLERCELLLVDASTDYVEDCLRIARRLEVVA
jgi:hypothetical protein